MFGDLDRGPLGHVAIQLQQKHGILGDSGRALAESQQCEKEHEYGQDAKDHTGDQAKQKLRHSTSDSSTASDLYLAVTG